MRSRRGGGRPAPLPQSLLRRPHYEDGRGCPDTPTFPSARSAGPVPPLRAAIGGGAAGREAGRAAGRRAQRRAAAGGSAPLRSALPPRLASPRRLTAAPAAAKTPRAVLRVKNGAAKLAKPPAAAGEAPGGAPGPGIFMERSQSRLSLSASFEALAIYFPCMNSFDEEDAGTGARWGGGCSRARGSRSEWGCRREGGGVRGVGAQIRGMAGAAGGAGGREWGRCPGCVGGR